jgi:hypothetical protein
MIVESAKWITHRSEKCGIQGVRPIYSYF